MTWSVKDKTILVTGGNSGIGFAGAEELSRMGARVFVTSRDAGRARAAAAAISARTGNAVTGFGLDFSSLAAIHEFADGFAAQVNALDCLVNNAGALFLKPQVSADGTEKTWAVNHLGPFLLTARLLPLLQKPVAARIVTTSSRAHFDGKVSAESFAEAETRAGFNAYGRSKLGNILFTAALARRLAGSSVTATCHHPGVVATGFFRVFPVIGPFLHVLARPVLRSPAKGAETLVHLAASDDVSGQSGGYYFNRRLARVSRAAADVALQESIWELSVAQTGAVWPFASVSQGAHLN